MDYINVHEIKARFSEYARKVMEGCEFIIAYRNRPFAILKPLPSEEKPAKISFGLLKGSFTVPEDFDQPLSEFEEDFYGD